MKEKFFVGIDDIGIFASAGILRELDRMIPAKLFNSIYCRQFFQVEGKTYTVPL